MGQGVCIKGEAKIPNKFKIPNSKQIRFGYWLLVFDPASGGLFVFWCLLFGLFFLALYSLILLISHVPSYIYCAILIAGGDARTHSTTKKEVTLAAYCGIQTSRFFIEAGCFYILFKIFHSYIGDGYVCTS